MTFQDLKLNTPLYNAIDDLGFTSPTPIQAEAFSIVASGKDVVGIAQTGTGKTYAYMLPILRNLKFSKQDNSDLNAVFDIMEEDEELQINQLEKEIKEIDVELATNYDEVIAQPNFFDNYQAKKDQLSELMETWEAITIELESLS